MKKLKDVYSEFILKAESAGYSRDELVLGEGAAGKILFLGEAPGKEETALGRPFVGKAGRILDGLLSKAGLLREELFVTNTVKFRPYKISAKGTVSNRPPNAGEIELCADCLAGEIEAVNPRLIVTLGNVPLRAAAKNSAVTIGGCHGKIMSVDGRLVFPMYHPASVIYNVSLSDTLEEDIVTLASVIKRGIPEV